MTFSINVFSQQKITIFFAADYPAHHCTIPDGALLNDSVPFETHDGIVVPSSCEMYENRSISNKTIPCQNGWTYDPNSGYEETIVTEVCNCVI